MAVAKMNAIFGMALGYKSYVSLVFTLAVSTCVAFSHYDLYDIASAALGMLSTLAMGLTVDGFGPISDIAGGFAELSEFPSGMRDSCGALDAAGNATAAIGKGFAVGSAALMPMALCGAFLVCLIGLDVAVNLLGVNVLEPITFGCIAALAMESVGNAAGEMVQEVRRQFSLTDSKGKSTLSGSMEIKPDIIIPPRCLRLDPSGEVAKAMRACIKESGIVKPISTSSTGDVGVHVGTMRFGKMDGDPSTGSRTRRLATCSSVVEMAKSVFE